MAGTPPIFDAHTRADSLTGGDLETLAFFGATALVTSAHDGYTGARAEDLLRHFDDLVDRAVPRIRAAGLAPYVTLGIHPAKIPWLGVDAVLNRLPDLLDRPEVVGVGEIGLWLGGEREEDLFRRQLELADALRRPVVVVLPERDQSRILKRTVALLLEAGVPGERALVVGADAAAVATVRGCGYRVGLGKLAAAEAAATVARHGPDGLLVTSEVGEGPSDPVLASRTVARMEEAGLSAAVVRRVAFDNAAALYGVDRRQ